MFLRWLLLPLVLSTAVLADHASELVRIHTEAIGGDRRLSELRSLRAEGKVMAGSLTLETIILAQAPNRVRTEVRGGGANLIQGYDGANPPWQYNDSEKDAAPRPILGEAAREFVRDAEFADPLVAASKNGSRVEYLGAKSLDGRKMEMLRVTRKGEPDQELWLDAATFFIVRQFRERQLPGGRQVRLETRFADFRPVRGVIQPRLIQLYSGGVLQLETRIERIEANPKLDPVLFTSASVQR